MPIQESHYKLDIRCDGKEEPYSCFRGTFYGDNLGRAKKRARQLGWKFKTDGTILCPRCMAEINKQKRKKKFKVGYIIKKGSYKGCEIIEETNTTYVIEDPGECQKEVPKGTITGIWN